ncbi:GNAT family N-acetyltransferase [Legionella erythra]|uniref:Acetyltransferase (GNAT) family protein n=1 Tax=Legionella erythra TaxID=448 RepID=A0A0W0TRI9_LEGER|nr:GNAT family N-acetyltransferase [Legionella erythra]KTC98091.1 Acetyltransferase (GNAT) family protein [Legionella erythra]
MTYPLIRKATPDDYDAIWSIWMQDHVIQWMSFTKQGKEEFKAHYERMSQTSDIYVLVDEVEGKDKVVAVRRIKFGHGPHRHTAEYCSMGVDKDSQGKGYAKHFYNEFLNIVREKGGIKRIQLTQSGGNFNAFHLADKTFSQEAIFPDWLKRDAHGGSFHLIERYVYQLIDENLAKNAPGIPSLAFDEQLPLLQDKGHEAISIKRHHNQFIACFNDKPILTVDFDPDDSVIRHIGFLTIQSAAPSDESVAALRQILSELLQEGRVKKLELFTESPAIAKLCQTAGFYVRGEKIASYFDEQQQTYKNEVGLEYSFMALDDARSLIAAKMTDSVKRKDIDKMLVHCQSLIHELAKKEGYDALGICYLENMAYQVVRDGLDAVKIISLADRRWLPLVHKMPNGFKDELLALANAMQPAVVSFFQPAPVVSTTATVETTPINSME